MIDSEGGIMNFYFLFCVSSFVSMYHFYNKKKYTRVHTHTLVFCEWRQMTAGKLARWMDDDR